MIAREEFEELYQDAGLNRVQAARFLGRSDRRFRYWLKHGAPEWVRPILRMRAGWLDGYGWSGWRMTSGRLTCVHWGERGFEPGELFAYRWRAQGRMDYAHLQGRIDHDQAEGKAMS